MSRFLLRIYSWSSSGSNCFPVEIKGAGGISLSMKYAEFRLGDIIPPVKVKKYPRKPKTCGNTPFVSCQSKNNGIAALCGEAPEVKNCITVSTNGNCFDCFYHDYGIVPSSNVEVLCKAGITDDMEISLYLCCVLKQFSVLYSWAHTPKGGKVFDTRILLPVVESKDKGHVCTADDIDWNYMRSRIRKIEQECVKELDREIGVYLQVVGLNDYELTQKDKDILALHRRGIKTRTFILSALFQVFHGKRLKKEDRIPGSIPLLTAGGQNQGVACYIGNDTETYNNAISIDMFGNCFYHDGLFAGDDNIYFFVNEGYTPEAKEYIAAAVSKTTKGTYSYSSQFRQPQADQLEVELPVSATGQPDFAFIEKYITVLEKQTIAGVVKYKDKIIEIVGQIKDT